MLNVGIKNENVFRSFYGHYKLHMKQFWKKNTIEIMY